MTLSYFAKTRLIWQLVNGLKSGVNMKSMAWFDVQVAHFFDGDMVSRIGSKIAIIMLYITLTRH